MVDTNQDAVQTEEELKKKKAPAKKLAVKTQDKPVVKKVPLKKDSTPVKTQPKSVAAPVKQIVTNARRFLKGAWSELKKVHWPGRPQIIAYTGVVLVAVTLVAVMIFAIDSLLSKVLQFIIPK